MRAHPEITGSLGEFETYRRPAMDSCQQFAWITLKTMPVHGFDHSSCWGCESSERIQTGEPNRVFEVLTDFWCRLSKLLTGGFEIEVAGSLRVRTSAVS